MPFSATGGVPSGISTADGATPKPIRINDSLSPAGLLTDIADRALRDMGKIDIADPLPVGTNSIGKVTAEQATATSLKAEVVGPTADNSANPTAKLAVVAGVANASAPTRTESNVVPLRTNLAGDVAITLDGETVTVTQATAANLKNQCEGTTAHDGAGASINPVAVGGYASNAEPAAVSADADIVRAWLLRVGAQVVASVPHLAMIATPYTLTSKTAQYTTQQTGVALWTPASGKKIVVISYQIQVGGTTAGTMQLWLGGAADTTYTRGTDFAIFDGEFAPSATLKPGVVQTGLWISPTVDFILRVTDSAAVNPLTVTVWGYEV